MMEIGCFAKIIIIISVALLLAIDISAETYIRLSLSGYYSTNDNRRTIYFVYIF